MLYKNAYIFTEAGAFQYGSFRVEEGKFTEILNTVPDDGYPVYLHTQPSSFRAIHLYTAFGFSLLCDPAVGHRENHLTECLPYLEYFMGEKYDRLTYAASDGTLHRAALTVEDNRF